MYLSIRRVVRWKCPPIGDGSAATATSMAEPTLPAGSLCLSPDSTSLCRGVKLLLHNDSAQLHDVHYVADVIRRIGLYRDPRGVRFYGVESKHQSVIRQPGALPDWQNSKTHGTSSGAYENYEGIWQEPVQLASALVHLARIAPLGGHISYLDLGVWTGWSTCFVAAYLMRISAANFSGVAVDVTDARIAASTKRLMRHLNTRYLDRRELPQLLQPAGQPGRVFDVCLLDALHEFDGVYEDYAQLAPHCKSILFHDIVQFDSFKQQGGGVPRFWSMLVRQAGRRRTVDFVNQPGVFPTVMGLGLLLPNDFGTAEISAEQMRWVQANQLSQGRRKRRASGGRRRTAGRGPSQREKW